MPEMAQGTPLLETEKGKQTEIHRKKKSRIAILKNKSKDKTPIHRKRKGEMKFKIKIKNKNSGNEWWEEYDKNIPGNTPKEAEKWASGVLKRFNETLRPNESPRELMKIEILEPNDEKPHEWTKRTGGMSVGFRGCVVDLMFCKKCGITGKRYGLSSRITIDSKFRKKASRQCRPAQIEMGRGGTK